jgi:hypothetical protein
MADLMVMDTLHKMMDTYGSTVQGHGLMLELLLDLLGHKDLKGQVEQMVQMAQKDPKDQVEQMVQMAQKDPKDQAV